MKTVKALEYKLLLICINTNYFQISRLMQNAWSWKLIYWCSAWAFCAGWSSKLCVCKNRVGLWRRVRSFWYGSTSAMELWWSLHSLLFGHESWNYCSKASGVAPHPTSILLIDVSTCHFGYPKRQLLEEKSLSEAKEAKDRKVCVFSFRKYCQAPGNGCLLVNICELGCSLIDATGLGENNEVFVLRCVLSLSPGAQPCQPHQEERFFLALILHDPRFKS